MGRIENTADVWKSEFHHLNAQTRNCCAVLFLAKLMKDVPCGAACNLPGPTPGAPAGATELCLVQLCSRLKMTDISGEVLISKYTLGW